MATVLLGADFVDHTGRRGPARPGATDRPILVQGEAFRQRAAKVDGAPEATLQAGRDGARMGAGAFAPVVSRPSSCLMCASNASGW